MKKLGIWLGCAALALSLPACKKGGLNLFTIQDDKNLGAQLKAEIEANPSQYPLLPFTGNETAYSYLYAMRDAILQSDNVKRKNDFLWETYIIHDDNTLNAFCAPGGYIYVYTGIIKFLDEADHLAGVMGHEIAHADERHSTEQMTQTYGLQVITDIILGNNQNQLSEIAKGLATLGFSRSHEKEADDRSVDYLCDTDYASNGAAAFFEKLIATQQAGNTPAFLSTHPNPKNRVQNINKRATDLGCSTALKANAGYAAFKAALP